MVGHTLQEASSLEVVVEGAPCLQADRTQQGVERVDHMQYEAVETFLAVPLIPLLEFPSPVLQ